MPEVPYDLKEKHPLLPHPKVTELYQEAKFKYDKTVEDLGYEQWYQNTKKVGRVSSGKITRLITGFYRTRQAGRDYIFYDVMLYGTDKTGNRLGCYLRMGKYQKPIFRKRIDARSDEVISHEVESKETVYEFLFSPELFDSLLLESIEESETQHLNLIVISPSRNYTIPDAQDFRDGTYQELIEIGKTGKSLATIRKEKEGKEQVGEALVAPEAEKVIIPKLK